MLAVWLSCYPPRLYIRLPFCQCSTLLRFKLPVFVVVVAQLSIQIYTIHIASSLRLVPAAFAYFADCDPSALLVVHVPTACLKSDDARDGRSSQHEYSRYTVTGMIVLFPPSSLNTMLIVHTCSQLCSLPCGGDRVLK